MAPRQKEIVYPIVPSRFSDKQWQEILEFVRSTGNVPFDHRAGVPFNDFELGFGREQTLKFLISIMKSCHSVGIFGCSYGGMGEWRTALEFFYNECLPFAKIKVFRQFDPDWNEYYEKLMPEFGDLISKLRQTRTMYALVGPRAIGKTFWINRLIKKFSNSLIQVKTTTSRPLVRGKADERTYNFLDKEEFGKAITDGKFLEYDVYHEHYYGSSLEAIFSVLDTGYNGIFAITPNGAEKLFRACEGFNLKIINLRPCSEKFLLRNFKKRQITDPTLVKKYLKEAETFSPPVGVDCRIVWLTGDAKVDERSIIGAMSY